MQISVQLTLTGLYHNVCLTIFHWSSRHVAARLACAAQPHLVEKVATESFKFIYDTGYGYFFLISSAVNGDNPRVCDVGEVKLHLHSNSSIPNLVCGLKIVAAYQRGR